MSSADVRLLMKQGNAKMSGKDKAQMLKSLLREKRKAESSIQSSKKIVRHENITAPSVAADAPATLTDSMPNGFYDMPVPLQSTSTLPVEHSGKVDVSSPSGSVPSAAHKSSVPVGFFDDAEADMNARGIDMYKELKKKDEKLNTIVNEFFADVQETADAAAEIEEDIDGKEDIEESAVQHAYLTRLANILVKADGASGSTGAGSGSRSGEIDPEEMEQFIGTTVKLGSSRDESDSSVFDGIKGVLASKYSSKGSKLENTEHEGSSNSDSECFDSDLDSDSQSKVETEVDWTSRSFL